MPQYAPLFPQAYERIQAAIDFLRKQKGVERVYLMGYSMGGRMMTGYLANTPDHGVTGLIGVGLVAGGPEPLNTNLNLRKIQIPVLDIYAENDVDARFAEVRRPFVSPRFVQVPIPGAQHDYRGFDQQILDATVAWLRGREGGK
jgi:pimeloyl-ACP methyl ester carboxylesterase